MTLLKKVWQSKSPILIYQMGKVGSSALEKSIPDSVHLHDLMSISSESLISPVRARVHKPNSQYMKRLVKRHVVPCMLKSKNKVKVISLVREPVGRNISMYFQALPFWLSNKYLIDDSAVREEKKNLLAETYVECLNHQYPLDWFDKEIKKLTGIDVFQTPFDSVKGSQRYQNKNFDLLVIRLDKIGESREVIEDFVGCPIELSKDNQASNKWYQPLIADFNSSLSLTPHYLNEMLTSKLTTHFYSESEINALSDKYTELYVE
ncbi:putative capsular polysaccharide synthesis family protein [Vibrio maerlii]|uniref:putative capsular polysaccharide synthesis family protein n=1 Tax=Vibrio maerlii TaxID=2231648 RepID=UPI000E3E7FCD|nr:putative capsular polysaccharide synthesis family protein [Vibrio maerlii]